MAKVEFKNNSVAVKKALQEHCQNWLVEAGAELTAETQRNTRVASGQTKGSFNYIVDNSKLETTVGSPLENAIWEELGTGEYALNGDGRKGRWHYKDKDGIWHTTTGKRGTRALFKAFEAKKNKLKARLQDKLKGLGK